MQTDLVLSSFCLVGSRKFRHSRVAGPPIWYVVPRIDENLISHFMHPVPFEAPVYASLPHWNRRPFVGPHGDGFNIVSHSHSRLRAISFQYPSLSNTLLRPPPSRYLLSRPPITQLPVNTSRRLVCYFRQRPRPDLL